jgi:hypothetical protein
MGQVRRVPTASSDRPLLLHCGSSAALPRTTAGVRTLALQQIAPLLDQLVGGNEYGVRCVEAECLGGLEVDTSLHLVEAQDTGTRHGRV